MGSTLVPSDKKLANRHVVGAVPAICCDQVAAAHEESKSIMALDFPLTIRHAFLQRQAGTISIDRGRHFFGRGGNLRRRHRSLIACEKSLLSSKSKKTSKKILGMRAK